MTALGRKATVSPVIIAFLIICVSIAAFSCISCGANQLPLNQGFIFTAYQIAAVLLPGIALTILLRIHDLDLIQFFGLSYAFGYALNIIEYYVLFPFGLKRYAVYLTAAVTVISVVFLIREYLTYQISICSDTVSGILIYLFFVAFLFLSFWAYNMMYISPRIVTEVSYYQDILYWIENSQALSRQYPPIDPRMSGVIYKYHYFSSMQIAYMHQVTKIDIFTLSTCFSYLASSLLLITSIYTVFKETVKDRWLAILASACLLFTTGMETLTSLTWIWHILFAPFGFDYGIAFCLFTLFLVIRQYNLPQFYVRLSAGILFLFFMTSGLKGPIAAVALSVIGILCVFWLFQKQYKKSFLIGVPCLLIFLAIYIFIINRADPMKIDPLIAVYHTTVFADVLMPFKVNIIHYKLFIIPWLIIWFFSSNLFISVSFILALIILLINYKEIEAIDIAFLSVIILAFGLTLLVRIPGKGQIYFSLAVLPIMLLFSFNIYTRVGSVRLANREMKAILLSLCILLMFVSALLFAIQALPQMAEGRNRYRSSKSVPNHGNPHVLKNISYDEYCGLDWIRENTDEEILIVTDRAIQDNNGIMYHGAFSNRQMYSEIMNVRIMPEGNEKKELIRRLALLKEFYSGDEGALRQLLSEGIDYVIQTNRMTPNFSLPDAYGEIVYQNGSITVYRLTG